MVSIVGANTKCMVKEVCASLSTGRYSSRINARKTRIAATATSGRLRWKRAQIWKKRPGSELSGRARNRDARPIKSDSAGPVKDSFIQLLPTQYLVWASVDNGEKEVLELAG